MFHVYVQRFDGMDENFFRWETKQGLNIFFWQETTLLSAATSCNDCYIDQVYKV